MGLSGEDSGGRASVLGAAIQSSRNSMACGTQGNTLARA